MDALRLLFPHNPIWLMGIFVLHSGVLNVVVTPLLIQRDVPVKHVTRVLTELVPVLLEEGDAHRFHVEPKVCHVRARMLWLLNQHGLKFGDAGGMIQQESDGAAESDHR